MPSDQDLSYLVLLAVRALLLWPLLAWATVLYFLLGCLAKGRSWRPCIPFDRQGESREQGCPSSVTCSPSSATIQDFGPSSNCR